MAAKRSTRLTAFTAPLIALRAGTDENRPACA